jgi:hypothetical protein
MATPGTTTAADKTATFNDLPNPTKISLKLMRLQGYATTLEGWLNACVSRRSSMLRAIARVECKTGKFV